MNERLDGHGGPDWVLGTYVHIPFCQYRCTYCDFATFAGKDEYIQQYLACLLTELSLRTPPGPKRFASTVFFGGGTPSRLPAADVERVLTALDDSFQLSPRTEVTLEANPGTLDLVQMRDLRSAGVNRLSIGVQTLNDSILRSVERIHDGRQALDTLQRARAAGFDSVSADLIFGLPGQDRQDWIRTLRGVIGAGPDHLSVYGLIVEPGTLLRRQLLDGRIQIPSDDEAADLYEVAREMLAANGYQHYEISNWARPGHQCRHNLIYWQHEPYLGIGLSAHSYLDGRRFANVRGLQGYIGHLQRGRLPTASVEPIDADRARADAAMLGLRLIRGIHTASFDARFGGNFLLGHSEAIARFAGLGLLEVRAGWVRLTAKGYLLANQVWQEFI